MPIAVSPADGNVRRLATLAAGLPLISLGVACTIRADIGVAPYDVLLTGTVAFTGIGIGIAAMLLPLLFILTGVLLGARTRPGTYIAALTIGPVLGLVLPALPVPPSIPTQLAYFLAGFCIVVSGITLVVAADIGPGPLEIVMLALDAKGYPLARARTGIEVICVVLGWAMGGQLGVGTIIFALLTGLALRHTLALVGFRPETTSTASNLASAGA
jgi:uncharacterized membrane protein YczE